MVLYRYGTCPVQNLDAPLITAGRDLLPHQIMNCMRDSADTLIRIIIVGIDRHQRRDSPHLQATEISIFVTQSKVVAQSTLLTPRTKRFTRSLPPCGSRDPLRLAEGGALPYKGARHCPGFSPRSGDRPSPATRSPAPVQGYLAHKKPPPPRTLQ